MKVWMWQRLYKLRGEDNAWEMLRERDDDPVFKKTDRELSLFNCIWLCPKPNLVLVDRKHLGGME